MPSAGNPRKPIAEPYRFPDFGAHIAPSATIAPNFGVGVGGPGAVEARRGVGCGPMADLFLGGAIDPATHERTTTDSSSHVAVATDSLTTHGVIVGMTGSGKTGLGVILIEEALRAGLPVLAIDPKGDLTNLCLTFPGPRSVRLPTLDRRGPGHERRRDARRVRRQPGRALDEGSRPVGTGRHRHRCSAGPDRLHDLHPRLAGRRARQHRRLAAGACRHDRRRGGRRRDRGLRHRPARSGRHRRRPARRAANTSCCRTSSSTRGPRDARSTSRRWSG